jgi:O-methyltransferase
MYDRILASPFLARLVVALPPLRRLLRAIRTVARRSRLFRFLVSMAAYERGYRFPAYHIDINDRLVQLNWDILTRAGHPDDKAAEARLKEWCQLIAPYTMVSFDGLSSLADQVRYCEEQNVPGVLVETGCCRGGSAALMARASLAYGREPRDVHIFDSFEGLPQPDAAKDTDAWIETEWKIPRDQHQGKMVGTGALLAQPEDVKAVFAAVGYPDSKLHIHKGWFCDTAPVFAKTGTPIAILRLDGDLYASTWDALISLYPLVSPGGVVIIDDFAIQGARQAVYDYLDTQPGRRPYISRADGLVGFFIKPAI